MEEKNIALLGFIASATEYLKNHVGEDYKNLEDLKDIDLDSIKKELAGNIGNCFDRSDKNARKLLSVGKSAFQNFISEGEKTELIDEFDEIFNVDFRKANKEKDERITNNLLKLLQGTTIEEDEIDEYAKEIASNREELINPRVSIKPSEAGIDDIFDEIIKNENGIVEPDVKQVEQKQEEKTEVVEKQVEVKKVEVKEEKVEPVVKQEEKVEIVEEQVENVENNVENKETVVEEEQPEVEEPIQLNSDEDYQKQVEKNTDDYIARLMKNLNDSNIADKIEENRKKEEEENQIYNEIKSVYPYLTDGFVRRVYDLKDSIDIEYEEGIEFILLQRLKFEDIDGLRKFVEVVIQHDYLVNVDERKMIVDVFKQMINSEGLILSEIFAIANQGRLLTGDYEGYRVLINEEQEGE